MTEESEKQENIETGESSATSDYIAAINELKKNSVNRQDYEKLKAENKQLLNSIVNGQEMPEHEVIPTKEEISEMRKELFNPNNEFNNLEYVKRALELRNACLKAGLPDPFVPVSSIQNPTPENYETAERVAKIFEECIEESDGSSEIFTAQLRQRTK